MRLDHVASSIIGTRITASCERLKCRAYPTAFATACGPSYQGRPNGSNIGNQIDAAFIFAGADFVTVCWLHRKVKPGWSRQRPSPKSRYQESISWYD